MGPGAAKSEPESELKLSLGASSAKSGEAPSVESWILGVFSHAMCCTERGGERGEEIQATLMPMEMIKK